MQRKRIVATVAAVTGVVLLVAGCTPGTGSSDGNGEVTLTLGTYGDFGYTDEMLAEYEQANPGVTIVQEKAADAGVARDNVFTKLGAGSGLPDVQALDGDWLAEVLQYPDKFVDLSNPEVDDRWLDWKYNAAVDDEGRLLGYGTDIGPQGVCYRKDLFEAAGLPTDRDEVAALLEGDWDHFYDVGRDYVDKTGQAWFDNPSSAFQGRINQVEYAFEDGEGNITAATDPKIEAIFREVVKGGIDTSAAVGGFTDDWYAGMANGTFATLLCPAWMLGIVSGNAPDVTTWDIANVFPGGGGIWGGSYLSVPAQGAHPEEAKALADWLTAPEQQIKAFVNAGPFPSQIGAYTEPELLDFSNEYFGNAPVGQIFIDRAKAVTVTTYKGPDFFQVYRIINAGITRAAEEQTQTVDESWNQVLEELKALE
ncbi:ABC transporter substrate-binding protein [Cryobacterium sp. MP_3.1]|uniref:ABC transporter substrate-binding protein n=1 Tax=Cryobacterium sp. MP_3.1 TaxID=3071711 RepID=UPI002E144C1E